MLSAQTAPTNGPTPNRRARQTAITLAVSQTTGFSSTAVSRAIDEGIRRCRAAREQGTSLLRSSDHTFVRFIYAIMAHGAEDVKGAIEKIWIGEGEALEIDRQASNEHVVVLNVVSI